VPGEYRFGDTRHIISDIGQLRALGWEPEVPLPEVIARYVSWAQSQPSFANYYAEAMRVMKRLGTVRSIT
jgi:dTDP-L-rhamnose 4-epimerase